MAEEKKTPAFTEAEEMELYEELLERSGADGIAKALYGTAYLLEIAVIEYKNAKAEDCKCSIEPLLTAIGMMQVMCNAAEVAFGDTAEAECNALQIIKVNNDLNPTK